MNHNKKQHQQVKFQKIKTMKDIMNRYKLIKKNENLIYQFVKNGILSYMVIRDMDIYKKYIQLDAGITKEMKYILLAEQFELSTDRIKQIIYNMETTIK